MLIRTLPQVLFHTIFHLNEKTLKTIKVSFNSGGKCNRLRLGKVTKDLVKHSILTSGCSTVMIIRTFLALINMSCSMFLPELKDP